jgi:hypothetical protein
MRAADALAEKTFEDSKERLYERLVSVFTKVVGPTRKVVSRNASLTMMFPTTRLFAYPKRHKGLNTHYGHRTSALMFET